MIDYLDKPPQRYRLTTDDLPMARDDGEWVKHADMDLYMFEGGQLMQQACARIDVLEMALKVLLPGLILDLRYADLDDDKDAMRARIDTVQDALAGSPSRPDNLSTGSALSDGATQDREGEHE